MKKYVVGLEREIKVRLKFSVFAESATASVRIVNNELLRQENVLIGSSRSLGDLSPVEWMMHLDDITENVSVREDTAPPLADDLRIAYRFLKESGYNYQGEDGEDALAADDAPLFTKPVWTEDGTGSDSFLQVRAAYESEHGVYKFQIEAILYPVGRGDIERGEAPFRVRFQDKQYFISAKELPLAVEIYEKLFLEFIKILRLAGSNLSTDTLS